MVLLKVGFAVSAAMCAISALCSFSAAANAAAKCFGSIFLNGGRPKALPHRASSGLTDFDVAFVAPPAGFRRFAVFTFAFLATFFATSLAPFAVRFRCAR
jgi:hypothetical protein